MAKSELYRKGAAIRRPLLGDDFVEQASRTTYADPAMRKFTDLGQEVVFGALWSRPGLDLTALTATKVLDEMKVQ
jgi:4-carboxymuconolactone decarboxylase